MRTGNLYFIKAKAVINLWCGRVETSWPGDYFFADSEAKAKAKAIKHLKEDYGWDDLIDTETDFEIEKKYPHGGFFY